MNDRNDTATPVSQENITGNNAEKSPLKKDEAARKRILIVDDVLVMRLRLRTQLEDSGFMVFEAEDGEKALAFLEYNPDIHLIITDVSMPVMDGIEFIRRLRKSSEYSAIPVIVCTAKGEFSVVRQAKQLGVQGFLVKPIAKPTLLSVIRRELD